MLKRRLDPDLITSLDKDGGGVDKTEFVVGMLVKLELVGQKDVEPYLKQFAKLDVDGSGVLTSEDLEAAALAMEAKVAEMKIPVKK
jgi:Ca2+-binding EF-hand superfamily protein